MTDDRAERAILSHAEAYRLVEEAREQRARADRLVVALAELRAAFIRHRTATHRVAPTFCHTCRESDAALARALSVVEEDIR